MKSCWHENNYCTGARMKISRLLHSFKGLPGKCMGFIILPAVAVNAGGLKFVPGNFAYNTFSKNGSPLLRKHHYMPIPENTNLDGPFYEGRSELVGLEMNGSYAVDGLQGVFPLCLDEFRKSFPLHKSSPDPMQFYLLNGGFMAIDARVYYGFIRHFKPKQIVEIGAGNSSVLAAAACRQDRKENGEEPRLTAIEPFPSALVSEGSPGLFQLIEDKVQNVDFELFSSLEAGDILPSIRLILFARVAKFNSSIVSFCHALLQASLCIHMILVCRRPTLVSTSKIIFIGMNNIYCRYFCVSTQCLR